MPSGFPSIFSNSTRSVSAAVREREREGGREGGKEGVKTVIRILVARPQRLHEMRNSSCKILYYTYKKIGASRMDLAGSQNVELCKTTQGASF